MWLIGVLNSCVRWVEQLPWASFDGIWLYGTDVLGIYLFLFLLGYYLNTCKARNLILSVFCLLAVCTCHMVRQANDRPKPGFVFYNVRNCPAVHCLAADGHSWLIYADSIPDTSRLRKAVSGSWNRLHLERTIQGICWLIVIIFFLIPVSVFVWLVITVGGTNGRLSRYL